eukprot:scaffold21206_cov112-Isochrysis_galbana.AAC.4
MQQNAPRQVGLPDSKAQSAASSSKTARQMPPKRQDTPSSAAAQGAHGVGHLGSPWRLRTRSRQNTRQSQTTGRRIQVRSVQPASPSSLAPALYLRLQARQCPSSCTC